MEIETNFASVLGFVILVFLQCSTLIIVKAASTDAISSGSVKPFKFSPSASLAVAECLKLFLSVGMLVQNDTLQVHGIWRGAKMLVCENVSYRLMGIYLTLGLAYAINNDLTFTLSTLTDPGSIALVKSLAPMSTAVCQWILYKKPLNQLQWISIWLVTIGVVVAQVEACKGVPMLDRNAYLHLGLSLLVTTFTSVVNAQTVRNSTCPLPIQNTILYSVGVVANSFHHYLRFPRTSFFSGMDNMYAVLIIVVNAFMGLAINVVYKYSTAVVKTVASCFAMAILVFVSALFFHTPLTVNTFSGAMVVILATYVYMNIAVPLGDVKQEGDSSESHASCGDPKSLNDSRLSTRACFGLIGGILVSSIIIFLISFLSIYTEESSWQVLLFQNFTGGLHAIFQHPLPRPKVLKDHPAHTDQANITT